MLPLFLAPLPNLIGVVDIGGKILAEDFMELFGNLRETHITRNFKVNRRQVYGVRRMDQA